MTISGKTKILFELGEAERSGDWPDYLQYGFDETDVPALLELVADQSLHQADSESNEVWAPLHAWRALGQIGSAEAASPLTAQFDVLFKDDWALSELSKVMGMIGEAAIAPLAVYLNERHHDEFARVIAADGLAEIAKHQPECRERVIQCYQDYMARPNESADGLNGLLIGRLMDLDAREAINDIRQLFGKGCVDISCAGDLEEVEIGLGFRTERSTPKPKPKPNYAQLHGLDKVPGPQKPGSDDILEVLDFYLMHYGHDNSILDVSELDGFFAALACAPDTIMPSRWMPAIWGGEALAPEWQNQKEFIEFSHAAFTLYNHVMHCLNEDDFQALFLEREVEGKNYTIVDEWCNGFLRGLNLWEPLAAADAALTEECIQPLRLFATEAGFEKRDAMSEDEVVAQQQLIEPGVRRLFQHFLAQRRHATTPLVRETPKTGRNDPCPCGSGKKFKKCCMH
jgi:uncharacterized protein